MNKNLKDIAWDDIPEIGEPITLLTDGVDTSEINIPKTILKGEKFLKIANNYDWTGLIPESEFSAYRNKIKGRYLNKIVKAIVKNKIVSKSGKKIATFSIKDFEYKDREDDLRTLQESDYVLAKVESCEDFQAILSYGKVQNLILTTPSFTHKGGLSVKDFFSPGDLIPIKWDRFKKNGRELRVLPKIEVPESDFEKELDVSSLEVGDELIGKVFSTKSSSVLIAVGKRPGSNIPQQAYSRHHPSFDIDDYLVPGMPVRVSIRSINYNKKGDLRLSVSILNVIPDYKEEKRIEYLSEVADLIIEDGNILDNEKNKQLDLEEN